MRTQSEAQEHFEPSGTKKCATWQHESMWQITRQQQDVARIFLATRSRCVLLHPFAACPPKETAQAQAREEQTGSDLSAGRK